MGFFKNCIFLYLLTLHISAVDEENNNKSNKKQFEKFTFSPYQTMGAFTILVSFLYGVWQLEAEIM